MTKVDAELVLVDLDSNDCHWVPLSEKVYISKNNRYIKPIIISETEKIEEGDFGYNKTHGIVKVTNLLWAQQEGLQKVIALPEHFSHQQLQDIVDGKLKEGKCLVECESFRDVGVIAGDRGIVNHIKLNPHITIYSVEEKMYTREEMIKNAFNFYYDMSNRMKVPFNLISENRTNAEEWFEQNVK